MILDRLRRLPLKPGAALFVLVALVPIIGIYTKTYDLYQHLGLVPAAVWEGQVWRLFTYPLLPMGMVDFIIGAWAILWLGAWLEREWSALECWLYGGIATTCAGALGCLLFPRFDGYLGGTSIIVAALLVIWIRLCGHQRIMPVPEFVTTVRNYALFWSGIIVLTAFFSCGRWLALPMLAASALAGWAYLTLRWKWLQRAPVRSTATRRGRQLEF